MAKKNFEEMKQMHKTAALTKAKAKHKEKSIADIKASLRTSILGDQSHHREQLLLQKRLKTDTFECAVEALSAEEEHEKLIHAVQLLHQPAKKLEALTQLKRCFARDPTNSRNFLRMEGLAALESCLLSSDSQVLQEAVWCTINLTAGVSLAAKSLRHFSPLLIRFLQGSDPQLQELCAWAIGNIAGDSHKHRETLIQQGCVPPLMTLISTEYHLSHVARTQSVLFALANLARDEDHSLIRCMQDNSVLDHLQMILALVSPSCDFCSELGWLLNYIYSRPETFGSYRDQYGQILNSVITKLAHILDLQDAELRNKVALPYLHCLGNMIGLSLDLPLAISRSLTFQSVVHSCLTSDSTFIQKEALWILANFMAEPSCRVLIMCQARFLQQVFQLCQAGDEETAISAIYLIEVTAKVSSCMCQYLVQSQVVKLLVNLLASQKSPVQSSILDILMDLLSGTVQAKRVLLQAEIWHQLTTTAVGNLCTVVTEKTTNLLNLLQLEP